MTTTGARFAGLTPLFAPRSVAILGASSDPARIGGRPIAYLKTAGFKGAIYPVNPNRPEVQGLKAYAGVAELPETPDVAIVALPAGIALQAIEELGARGVKAAVVFTAGFAEVDAAGEAAQARMVAAARSHGLRLLGPNCLGVFDGRTGYYATFSTSFDSGWPVIGRIGIASPVGGVWHPSLYAGAQSRDRRVAVHHDRQRGRRDGRRMHRLAGGKPRGRCDRGVCRGDSRGAGIDCRV